MGRQLGDGVTGLVEGDTMLGGLSERGLVILQWQRSRSWRVLGVGVHFLVLGGLVGGRVVGSRGGGAGGDLGVHGVGMLEGEEINVRGEHGYGVGLERGNKCLFDFKNTHKLLIEPTKNAN